MKKIFLLVFILLLYLSGTVSAQSEKTLARDARITMKYKEYATAIELYEQLLKTKPDDLEYNYQIGVCHLYSETKSKALGYLKKVHDENPNYKTDLEFNLATAYHLQADFDEAKTHYEKAAGIYEAEKSSIAGMDIKDKEKEERVARNSAQLETTQKRIKECENGLIYEQKPINASIENLGSGINSDQPDYVPLIPKDTSFMIFTSRRENTTGGKRAFSDDLFYEDIYQADYSQGKFSSPKNLDINLKYHDAGAALDANGKVLYLYRDSRKTKGDLYISKYDEATKTWGEPEKLNENINTEYQETSLTLSEDGKTMYFASDRPGGLGGLDIYKSELEGEDNWGPAVNLGQPVNTAYDDDAPFLAFDGTAIYFSSRGHDTMGGYDVFKSIKNGDSWGDPSNMGFPINGPDDDIHLVLTEDNRKGYYVSDDPSGMGFEDIYALTAPKYTLTPLDKTGLSLTVPPSARIEEVPEPDFAFQVLFDFDQSVIRDDAKESVENLYNFLNDNSSVRVELSGHTCNIGSLEYNRALSERRARAVANYLIDRGIDANRLEAKGYSFENPAVPNTSPTNRAQNRRTEFSVLKDE